MASSSSGRYRSRLFNWLSQGLDQLGKLQPPVRQLRMRVAWGVQVIFYWAYGLFQMARSAKPSLGQAGQQPLTTGTAPSDQSIQQILLEVQQSYLSPLVAADSALVSQQNTSAAVPIQGIATLLATRTLVLVGERNQLLDILTLDQQERLHCQISEAAVYQLDGTQTNRSRLPRLQAALGQVLAWMPSPLARPIINRLKTRATTASHQLQSAPSTELTITPSQSLVSGRKFLTQLKSKIGNALGWLGAVSLQVERQVGRQIQQKPQQDLMPTEAKDDNLKIQALIRAAIAYFFNWQPLRRFHSRSSTPAILDPDNFVASAAIAASQQSPESSQLAVGAGSTHNVKPREEPWLTLADLFGGPEVSLANSESGAVAVRTQPPRGLTQTSEPPTSQEVSGTSASTTANEWLDIETEAILMGYIKHPLEQVLEWVDRGLAWLEGLIAALWTHLRPYLSALFQVTQQYWRR